MPASIVNVRYMVDDVEAAITWYTRHLGFTLISGKGRGSGTRDIPENMVAL